MLKKRRNDINENMSSFSPIAEEKKMPSPASSPGTSLSPVSAEEKTVIGQHISVEGVVRGKENLVIEGSMKGSIELEKHQVTVGSKGQVEAEIQADNVIISGRLVGNIQAHGKVEITKEADFSGEIKAKRISVEDGAYLKAVIELERESDKKEIPLSRPAAQSQAGISSSMTKPGKA
ncbi:MAG: polymer-forming cytoskeletal protein, partial [Deltaproteobacteria bacterium]|nr:polymer-forming cytoskeletal protein [Deltaproteobacteria bacterium]